MDNHAHLILNAKVGFAQQAQKNAGLTAAHLPNAQAGIGAHALTKARRAAQETGAAQGSITANQKTAGLNAQQAIIRTGKSREVITAHIKTASGNGELQSLMDTHAHQILTAILEHAEHTAKHARAHAQMTAPGVDAIMMFHADSLTVMDAMTKKFAHLAVQPRLEDA